MSKFLSGVVTLALVFAVSSICAAELPNFVDLAAKCGPAVVNVNTERKASASGPDEFFGEMFRNMPPGFEKFFDQFGGKPQGKNPGRRQMRRQRSLGSGFLVSADGYIVTNNHVVAEADSIKVTMDGQNGKAKDYKATLIGSDEETDLALLKIDASNLPFLTFGNSDNLKVGEWLLAIGNPFGLDHTVTAGILSAINRNIRSGPFDNFLQTDASINPGNSGGPLLNMAGQVIGINTAIIASGQGIGFAIPSNMAAKIIDQIKDGKKISRGWIGVTIQDVDENVAKALGLKDQAGALVGNVLDNEPAQKAGIRDGDVILEVDGRNIEDSAALLRAIADKAPGSHAVLTVWRDGKTTSITVTLGERKSMSSLNGRPGKKEAPNPELGISVRVPTEKERKELKLPANEGLVIVDVESDKPAAEAGLMPGDVILKVNQKPVNSASELSGMIRDMGSQRGAIMLQIRRGNDTLIRGVPIGK